VAADHLRIDTGVATLALPGQRESGDYSLVKKIGLKIFVAVVDGLGHGEEAASAAHTAVATLDRFAHEALPDLVRRCQAALTGTRGAVMTVGQLDPTTKTLTWIGIGNIEGLLIHKDPALRPAQISLVGQPGFLGSDGVHLTHIQSRVTQIARGDVLILATDGVKNTFAEGLPQIEPQPLAEHILHKFAKGTDDALVLVAHYVGG
jgi:phosphoserine phosphatase RsbX